MVDIPHVSMTMNSTLLFCVQKVTPMVDIPVLLIYFSEYLKRKLIGFSVKCMYGVLEQYRTLQTRAIATASFCVQCTKCITVLLSAAPVSCLNSGVFCAVGRQEDVEPNQDTPVNFLKGNDSKSGYFCCLRDQLAS